VKSVEFQLDNAGGRGKDQAVKLVNEWEKSPENKYRGKLDVSAVSQPPSSPDTNIDDLGLFAGFKESKPDLQAIAGSPHRVLDRLRDSVEQHAYVDWKPTKTIEKTIGTLRAVCRAIVATKDDNTYKIRDYKE